MGLPTALLEIPMTPDEAARARAIFDSALKRESQDRGAFLQTACAGDAKLLIRVRDLLSAYERMGDFFEHDEHQAGPNVTAEITKTLGTTRDGVAAGQFYPGEVIGDRFVIVQFLS